MSPGPEGSDDAARPAPLTRRYRCDRRVEGIHAGVSIGNGMPPDRLALRRYDEFGVTWPIPEQTVWRVHAQQVRPHTCTWMNPPGRQ